MKSTVLLILALICGITGAAFATEAPSALSLAGTWRFALDRGNTGESERWFERTLAEKIELPGSCEQRGFGDAPAAPEVLRLTHVLKYTGPAWYQRDIEIPAEWSGKRVELFLERCHWETTVYLDGRKIGMQNSLSVPHQHDLGALSPGKHTLTVCVDNSYKLKIGVWGHSIAEDTQTNWNGIIGAIELRVTDPVWIRAAQVFSDKIRVNVGNLTGQEQVGKIAGSDVRIPAGGGELEIPFTPAKTEKWDEFSPVTHTLDLKLTAGTFSNTLQVPYALRELVVKDKQFVLNGRPIFMRGPVDECVYPLTGYPPTDKASWLRVLGICKSHGFNFMRFHSWCPPEAAFEAGDELGFLFQIELPLWTIDAPPFGQDAPRDQFIHDELKRILDTYGNHPSFGFMAMGNESHGSLDSLTQAGRARDPRPIYRIESGGEDPLGFIEQGQRGVYGPRTDWDRWTVNAGWIAGGSQDKLPPVPSVPMFAHEVGQWAMYPQLDEVKKYTGTLRAHTFERYRKSLEENHMLDQAKDFAEASGKFSMLLYKDEIEASLRSWPYGGVQILEARDYPGQRVAIVGWLDAFWDSKGLISPEKFREFCSPTVCLLRMSKRVLDSRETFTAKAQLAHYGPKDIEVTPTWKIADDRGQEIAAGSFPKQKAITGKLATLGDISAPLHEITTAARLTVTVSAGETSNSWHIWAYPPVASETPADVSVVHDYDPSTRALLANGKRVLLLSSPKTGVIPAPPAFYGDPSIRVLPSEVRSGKNAVAGSFMPAFWNLQLFNQIGTLGLLCDPRHPAFAGFPTEKHSDWQWADLLGNFSGANSFADAFGSEQLGIDIRNRAGDVQHRSKAFILTETPPDYRPILQVIDNQERNAKLGSLFETRVGPGKLLVCGIDLDTDLAARPAARQLRKSLLDYCASDNFTPTNELSDSLLTRLLSETFVWDANGTGSAGVWTDTSATGWNTSGAYPVSGYTATIHSGAVTTTANNQTAGVNFKIGAATLDSGDNYMIVNANTELQGGSIVIGRSSAVSGWVGGAIGGTITVSGSAASSINGGSYAEKRVNMANHTIFDVNDVTTGADLTIRSELVDDFNGSSSPSVLVKTGNGTLTMTANNGYSGATTVSGGVLDLGNGIIYSNAAWGSRSITINGGGTVKVSNWGDGNPNTAGGFGPINFGPSNIVLDNGTIEYVGGAASGNMDRGFTIGVGGATLVASGSEAWQITQLAGGAREAFTLASNGGLLTLSGSGNGLVGKAIGGSGGLTKTGSGTWTLTAANSYTGDTTINSGTLSLGNGSSNTNLADTANLILAAGATLHLNYSGTDTVNALTVAGIAKPPGIYSSSNSPFITGPGTLTVLNTQVSDYDAWSGSAALAGGPNDDDDHDAYPIQLRIRSPRGLHEVLPPKPSMNSFINRFLPILLAVLPSVLHAESLDRLREDFLQLKFGMFIHFNMGTFHEKEWVDPGKDPASFNPSKLDCGQWADAAKSAGMKYAVLTTKHHDGFCLWDSKTTTYDVATSPLKGRDIVREYCDAFRKRGIEPHFYFSIWDRQLGIEGDITAEETGTIKAQLTELLTGYGRIGSLTFDGWGNCGTKWTQADRDAIYSHIKSLQPDILITDHYQLRRKLPLAEVYQVVDVFHYEEPMGEWAPAGNSYASQQGPTIQSAWFWKLGFPREKLMSVDDIVGKHLDVLKDRRCNFLLNCAPNRDGLMDENVVRRLAEVGRARGIQP